MTSIDDIFNDNSLLAEEPMPVFEKNWQMQINICDGLYLGSKISKYYMKQKVIPTVKWLRRYLDAHPLITEHTDVICYAAEFPEPYPEYCRIFQEARKKGLTKDPGMTFSINAIFQTKIEIYRFILDMYFLTIGEQLPWVMTFRQGGLYTMVNASGVRKIHLIMLEMNKLKVDTSLSFKDHLFFSEHNDNVPEEDIYNLCEFVLNACKK